MPSKEKLAEYQAKIKYIGKMKVKNLDDFNQVKAKFDSVKKEFTADQAIVKAAKKQFSASKQRIVNNISALKNAPKQDWQAIENKYQLDNINTEDFAHILFGEKARGYYQKVEKLYKRIAPFINSNNNVKPDEQTKLSATGRFIHFDEDSPLPAFLVKQATLSMVLEQGDFEITAKELTHQHWYRNKATELHVNSTNLTNGGDVRIDSQFKLAKNGRASGQGKWLIKEVALINMSLSDAKSLALTLTQGELSGSGKFNVNQNNTIDSNNQFALTKASYQGEADTKFTGILLDTVKSLDALTLGVNVEGAIDKPIWHISSSLDKAVKGAFKAQIANKLIDFKTQVNSGLNEKLAQSLQLNNQENTEFVDFEALLGDTDSALEQLKNSDVVKQQKNKLENKAKDKLQDKLKGKLGDLFG